ncbi:hypothetical protein [Acinetobacter gerneri]|uniref:hypothetical protein n=1 Tax=Acinetobacter gerneri TaxID=202952 RepID=UPI0028ACC2A2|nr:hypothetical protein [Acinetobacter gerneri]
MDIQNFINEFKHTFVYDLLSQTLTDDQLFAYTEDNGQVIWFKEQMRQIWKFAKSQAVPEVAAINEVISERKRQITQEYYSTDHDDEYQQNELLRAAVSYAENVVSRGWVYNSTFGPDVYQSEEAPDLWPWDLDFWKPKNPRRDLVRAAALIIAEIEKIDRITGARS